MRFKIFSLIIVFLISVIGCTQEKINNEKTNTNDKMNNDKITKPKEYNKLTAEEENVIVNKGTERPFTGKYDNFYGNGTYICKRCNAPLYRSKDKFDAGCGWPSFDDAIPGAIISKPDPDGMRTEIECANCGAHLGHVFLNEGLTEKETRYCVNSVSMKFIADSEAIKTDTAIFAGGCFWGVQYYLDKEKGVISTTVGYTGGHTSNPTYKEVCSGTTGHAEAIQVLFDPKQTSYETLAKLFFELHDPTQVNRQGPDVGEQYRSAVFYINDEQKQIAEKLINLLKDKGYKVATEVSKASTFWKAEDYHQEYYDNKGGTPYCHKYTKRFD
jgi:peptide methionine sulfoxide reductase msrA/msrB